MPSEPLTDAQLNFLGHHAEYGHFEGQDYDAVETLVAEVQLLRARIAQLKDAELAKAREDPDFESWPI
jgi:hypothetical protein